MPTGTLAMKSSGCDTNVSLDTSCIIDTRYQDVMFMIEWEKMITKKLVWGIIAEYVGNPARSDTV